MISIQNLSVQFSGEPLFDHVSFIINEKDRIGLVGKNGAGKSTLLRIIAGQFHPEDGEAVIPQGCTIGYLRQEMQHHSTQTVYQEAKRAFLETETLRESIARMERELEHRTDFTSVDYQRLLKNHHEAYERFHLLGGHALEAEVEKTLTGLGFKPSDFNRSLTEFSHGWQMRVEIAKILLQQPSLIMLDEPTNHLDIESIQWLEEFLIQYKGAVILVSHDRAFLDNVTRRTIEITFGRIYDYKANYSAYVELREERMESQIAAYNNQQRQIRQIERFIERFRYKNTKAKQVQSRLKMLEKLDDISIDLIDQTGIHFSFPSAPHAGKIVMEAGQLGKSYGTNPVLSGLDFQIINGDRIAFVGRNGEGKTTLSRILAGRLDHTGMLKKGHQVVVGYYAQDQTDFLDPDQTVFKTIDDIATGDIRPKIRGILGNFLFSGEEIDKKVKVLSGGEKSRLSLARLLLTPCNLLILDEPTNHLDMHSKDVLKNALLQFTGTLIIVSHDRDFLQGLTSRVFEFRDNRIREYIGDIYDFLEQRRLRSLTQLEAKGAGTNEKGGSDTLSENKQRYEKRKQQEREERRLRNRIEKCEKTIETLEGEIALREEILKHPGDQIHRIADGSLFLEYESLKEQLKSEMEQWEGLHLEMEATPGGE